MQQVDPVIVGKVRANFLCGDPASDFFSGFDAWLVVEDGPLRNVTLAFLSNLKSAVSVANVPFTLASTAAHERRFGNMLSAERIRHLKSEFDSLSKDEKEKAALSSARQRLKEAVSVDGWSQGVAEEIVESLAHALNDPDFQAAADELLRQIAVMIWGAMEVLATDTAIEILNAKPDLASKILNCDPFKRTGAAKGIAIEILQDFGFDVSHSMGSVLFGERRLDSVQAIRSVCEHLFQNADLDKLLKSDNLWTLAQRRHLIVHRRGVVDAQYLSTTSDKMPIGAKIPISAGDIEIYITEVRDIGLLIVQAAHDLLQDDSDHAG